MATQLRPPLERQRSLQQRHRLVRPPETDERLPLAAERVPAVRLARIEALVFLLQGDRALAVRKRLREPPERVQGLRGRGLAPLGLVGVAHLVGDRQAALGVGPGPLRVATT
jgi:hypothetical protein